MPRISELRLPRVDTIVYVPVPYAGAFGVSYQFINTDLSDGDEAFLEQADAEKNAAAFAKAVEERRRGIDHLYHAIQASSSGISPVPLHYLQKAEEQLQAVFEASSKSQFRAGFTKRV